jgi:hypothetical protein
LKKGLPHHSKWSGLKSTVWMMLDSVLFVVEVVVEFKKVPHPNPSPSGGGACPLNL